MKAHIFYNIYPSSRSFHSANFSTHWGPISGAACKAYLTNKLTAFKWVHNFIWMRWILLNNFKKMYSSDNGCGEPRIEQELDYLSLLWAHNTNHSANICLCTFSTPGWEDENHIKTLSLCKDSKLDPSTPGFDQRLNSLTTRPSRPNVSKLSLNLRKLLQMIFFFFFVYCHAIIMLWFSHRNIILNAIINSLQINWNESGKMRSQKLMLNLDVRVVVWLQVWCLKWFACLMSVAKQSSPWTIF